MKLKSFFVFFLLLFCVFGCGDEGVLLDGLVPSGPSPLRDVGPVPEDIQAILWGKDVDTLMVELETAFTLAPGIDRDIQTKHLIHKICLRREQEAFHSKYISAGGVAIMGNKILDDRFFYVARDLVLGMTHKRPELRELLSPSRENRPGATQHPPQHDVTRQQTPSRKFRMILSHAHTAIPETHLGGGVIHYPIVPLGTAGGHYAIVPAYYFHDVLGFVAVFVHEFAHAIHFAIRLLDPTFDDRLAAAYDTAKENGSYFSSGDHALRNKSEYWAESAQRWFTVLSREEQESLHDEFRRRDPLMSDLLAEWFDLIYLGDVKSKEY